MTFFQAIGQEPAQSYHIEFDDIYDGKVLQALARAHAASGRANAALAWANQIGNYATNPTTDYDQADRIKLRAHALLGIAEGILDRIIGGGKGVTLEDPFP